MAKYAIFSDLHIGGGGPHDLFGKKDYAVLKVWTKLLAKGYTILLNGDIFEYWKNSEWRVRRHHHVIWNFIHKTPDIILLVGNHDFDVMGVQTFAFNMADGRRVLVSHGFQNDKWMFNPFLKAFVVFAGWLERFAAIQLEQVFRHIYSEKFDKDIEKNTRAYARTMHKKFDIVICGHTHIQTEVVEGNKIYLNSGHGQGDRLEFIKINTRKNSYSLKRKVLTSKEIHQHGRDVVATGALKRRIRLKKMVPTTSRTDPPAPAPKPN